MLATMLGESGHVVKRVSGACAVLPTFVDVELEPMLALS
jgi:hypothetical protein